MARRKSVTLRDISERVGVSVTAVSAVVNARQNGAHVSETTRAAILDAARELGYVPTSASPPSADSEAPRVAILCMPWYDPLFGRTVAELCRACREYGLRPFLELAADAVQACRSGVALCADRQADALVLLGSRSHPDEVSLGDIPGVVIGEMPEGTPLMQVCTHNVHGGQLVAEHLWALGHRCIGVILVPGAPYALKRLAGVRAVWEAHGLCLPLEWTADLPSSGIDERFVQTFLERIAVCAGQLPTALFCVGDTIAAPAVDILTHLGIRVPAQMSVVGFDDHPILAARSLPPLTTVRTPFAQLGHVAAQLLRERLDRGPSAVRTILLPGELVIRASSGPAPHIPS